MLLTKKLAHAALVAGLVAAGSVQAVTLSGDNVTFTFDDALLGLFGTPSVAGDSLLFTPTTFIAKTVGTGIDLANATMNIQVAVKSSSMKLESVNLAESGDYLLFAPLGPSNMGVNVTGQLRAIDLGDFSNKAVTAIASGPLGATGMNSASWSTVDSIAMGAWDSDAASITIENILLAYATDPVSLAMIEKKDVVLSVGVTPVPEAETWAMLLAGLGLVGMQLRRRTRRSDKLAVN